jgi:hypothetical protein
MLVWNTCSECSEIFEMSNFLILTVLREPFRGAKISWMTKCKYPRNYILVEVCEKGTCDPKGSLRI